MKSAVLIIIIFILGIIFLDKYLSPNDFSGCGIKPDQTSRCKKSDAIVAVSGGDTNARLAKSIELFKNGWGDKLIFSGAAQDKSGPSNAKAMKQTAIASGIEESSILIDESSESTKQNASNTAEIFSKERILNAIVVTSGYHQRRASFEFKKFSPQVEVRSYPIDDKDWSGLWWTNLRGWTLATSELTKNISLSAGNR